MRFTALVFLMAITVWVAGCSPSSPPPPLSTPPPVAPSAAPVATATPVARTAAPSPSATLALKPEVTVEAHDDFFRPEKITITVGTKVNWVNLEKHDHTVTYGTLFNGDLKVGNAFSFTFDKPGTYHYYCVIHSQSDTEGMVGTITVSPP